jgi:hypothetical protein
MYMLLQLQLLQLENAWVLHVHMLVVEHQAVVGR